MAVVVTVVVVSVAIMTALIVATFMAISFITAVITPAFATIAIAVPIPPAAVDWSRVRIVSVVGWRGIIGAMLDYHIPRKAHTDSNPHLCIRLRRCNQSACYCQTE
jgi:hypothetical protein